MFPRLSCWFNGHDYGNANVLDADMAVRECERCGDVTYEDPNVHTTGGQRRVVYVCPGCGTSKVRKKGGENPAWCCTDESCGYHSQSGYRVWNCATWRVDRTVIE